MISVASIRKGLKSLSLVGLTVVAVVSAAIAAVPGFPFTEDFTSNALEGAGTTADWDTTAPGTLRLGFATELTGMSLTRTPLGNLGEVPTTSRDVVLGDIDDDGDLDAITATGGTGGQNAIYINNNGAFDLAPVALGTDSSITRGMAIGDLDRDGDLDVVAGNFQSANVYHLNDGAGNFTAGDPVAARADNTWRVHLADVDGDSDLDLIESVSGNRNFLYVNQLMENGGVLSFSSSTPITPDNFETRSLALGDVDNDGDMDFIAGDKDVGNHAYRWFNGSFVARPDTMPPDANTTFSVALADLDGDGWLDLVEGNAGATTQIYFNQGVTNPGFFSNPVSLADSNAAHVTVSLITRDMDRDGDIDIVEGNNGVWDDDADGGACSEVPPGGFTPCVAQPLRLYLNTGNGTFANAIDFVPPAVQKIYGMAAGDINGDGQLDFVTAHSNNNPGGPAAPASNAVYVNAGTPSANSVRQLNGFAISSVDVDGGGASIPTARLTVSRSQAATLANLDFFLSNDNGNSFIPAAPGIPVAFPNPNGNGLMWKVEMLTGSPNAAQLAEVGQIGIASNSSPNFTDIGDINGIEGQTLTATSLSLYFGDPDGDAMTYQLTGLPAGTGLSLDPSNGQISGVPTNEDEVASPITLAATAFDGAASTTGNITLNVLNAIDNPPVANDDGPYMLDEGGSIASTFNVLDNDTDSDSPTLNAVLVDPPLNSALFELKPDGTFDYTHDGGETTTDSFTYRADDGVSQSAAATVSLAINPVNDAPVVSVTGPDTVNIKVGDAFADAGASATDAEDGDITADIVVGGDIVDTDTAGTYVITYDVTDSNGAPATQVTRTVNVATNNAPVITLTGAAAITLTTGDAYADAGATAMDDEDGDITANIVVGGAVNTAAAGVYTLTYNVMDMDGNAAAEVTRTVTVNDPPPPPPPPRKKKGGGATGLLEFFGLGFAGLLMFRRRRARKLLA
jgi:VCBS repeat-containing protein